MVQSADYVRAKKGKKKKHFARRDSLPNATQDEITHQKENPFADHFFFLHTVGSFQSIAFIYIYRPRRKSNKIRPVFSIIIASML